MSPLTRWLIFTVLNLGIIGFYLYRAFEIRRDYDVSRPPIRFLIFGHVSLVLAVIGFTIPSAPYLLRLLVPLLFHSATLFTYISQYWVVHGHNIHYLQDKRFLAASIVSLITVFLNYQRGENLNFFIGREPMDFTLAYYLPHSVGFALSAYLCFLVSHMFWSDFIDSDDYTYALRRFIGASSFFIAFVCALTLLINLVLTTMIGDIYRHSINQVYFILMPIHNLLMAITLLPQPIFNILSIPLKHILQDDIENHNDDIAYLHKKLSEIVFSIYKVDKALLSPARIFLETETMLRIAISHVKPRLTNAVHHEARFIVQQAQAATKLYQPGPYRVHRGGLKHLVRVAKQVRQFETEQMKERVHVQSDQYRSGAHSDVPVRQSPR